MKERMLRLQQVQLNNFKNVRQGQIDFNSYKSEDFFSKTSDVLGIYGQNGSGKTAFIEALWILKLVLLGESLPGDIKDYIYQGEKEAAINTVFSMSLGEDKYQLFYEMVIERRENAVPVIIKEDLSYKKLEEDGWTYKRGIITHNLDEKEQLLSPQKNYNLLTKNNKDAKVDLKVAKELAKKDETSFIFSSEMDHIYKGNEAFNEFAEIIMEIKQYARMNLFVIRNSRSGMINANLIIPFCFQFSDSERIEGGDLAIALSEPTTVPERVLSTVKNVIENLNIVLKEIIPELTIKIKEYGEELDENGDPVIKVELLAERGEIKIPLRYESDGIKKIISILSAMIAMYNKPGICLAVDELDAGIFEYLLGEILEIIQDRAKGQLVFTSHNLRPLEKLNKESLIFTTTNPQNRYIRFTNVKETNNLRSFYYRGIKLGGQDEEVYERTNEYKIARAFRAAGRVDADD
ncbi:putative AbiEii toxin of type IV toxin-antitoxin system [Halanaerobium congolense]|uniref:Putative AbiEii toxin of type IV toxin-antitoxin system n=1 Tax=Halanaerobium congolense TaxID=54121 RepID=A0A4R8GPD9_9FIRM|nr:AAA family ATPase [Halanaerobium congolense]TDX46558.1 putative AbiEii toxin of type IV toxin-antitoxin system [Halanaerobium congolense]